MFFACFFLLAALCSAASASNPEPCTTPNQWEGTVWFIQEDIGVTKLLNMSYDAVNKRIQSESTTLNGPYAGQQWRMILLFSENRYYFFLPEDPKLCVCVEFNKLFEFTPARVPPNATFRYHITRGLGENSVTTNTWAMSYKVGFNEDANAYPWSQDHDHYGHTHTWFASFTDDLCVPVLETIYEGDLLGKDYVFERTGIFVEIRYSDISAGIKDPSVFDPPSYCNVTGGASKNAATLLAALGDTVQWPRFMFI